MDVERARFLVSPAAAEILDVPPQPEFLSLPLHQRLARLRESFAPEDASALSEQIDLQSRAAERFGPAVHGWRFTREGLEMATHPLVAERRARRFAELALPVADLNCGIGGDLAAFAAHCGRVVGVERDAAPAILAAHNAGCGATVVRGDALRPPVALERTAVMLDPSRRAGPLRRFDPAAFTPPWDACLDVASEAAAGALKGPPGIADAAIPAEAEVEFVQLGRSLREAALYLGRGARPGLRRAVLLPGGDELSNEEPESDGAVTPIGGVLYDPASCVTRAGLVRQLAHRLGASLIDPRLGYLSGASFVESPFADAFAVAEVIPFSVARLKRRLREAGWAPREIRRRAFPVEPDDLRRQIGVVEGEAVTLLCMTVASKRLVVVGRLLKPGR